MKFKYLFGIIAIVLLLTLSGCKSGEVVDENLSGNTVSESGGDEGIDVEIEQETTDENLSNKELIEKLSKEQGIVVDEDEEETVAESEDVTITIENFEGDPEDVDIKVGTTVTFLNEQENFKHVIGITPWENGKYTSKPIENEWHPILEGESWSYTFEEAGKFRWLSKSNYPDTQGEIEVTE